MNNRYWWKQSFFEQHFDHLFGRFIQYEDIINFLLTIRKLLNCKTVRVIIGHKALSYSEEEIKILESPPVSSQPNAVIKLSDVGPTWVTDEWMALDVPAIVRKHRDINSYDCMHKDLTLFYKKYEPTPNRWTENGGK